MRIWSRCSHTKTSAPITEPRTDDEINRITNSFVICRDCEAKLPYSYSESRVVGERRKTSPTGSVTLKDPDRIGGTSQEQTARSRGTLKQPAAGGSPPIEGAAGPAKITQLHKAALQYHSQNNERQAERLYRDILALAPTVGGEDNPELGQVMNNLARLYHSQGKYDEAEPLYLRSLSSAEHHFGGNHPKVARRLANLGDLYRAMDRKVDAALHYQRAASILNRDPGPDHPNSEKILKAYVSLLRELNRNVEAEDIENRMRKAPA